MSHILSLAYSTCPNDTYAFYALAHDKIDTSGLGFNIFLNDVEQLNQDAKAKTYDVSKLSFAALGYLADSYGLLRTGAALGSGCGPLVVSREGVDLSGMKTGKIAVPGLWTTACLLLQLYMPRPADVFAMPFDRIMPAVLEGRFDYGVIIHEGRFTYKNYGLNGLLDLGEWWETETGLPVPLGGIAIRRDITGKTVLSVEAAIKKSIEYAHAHPAEPADYIKSYAQELSDTVIQQHIRLYVNPFSLDLGREGEQAIHALFNKSRKKGIIPASDRHLFAYE